MVHPVYERRGQWTFITSVGNVVLTDAVASEFTIDRVLLIDAKKIPRVRKRLGFHQPVSEIIRRKPYYSDFFKEGTFAIVRYTGTTPQVKDACFNLVKDALSILALSQHGYKTRRITPHIGLRGVNVPGGTRSRWRT